MNPYQDFVDFIVAHIPAEKILQFRASEAMHDYAYSLLDKEKAGLATAEERKESDQILNVGLVVRLMKAKAYRVSNQ